MPKRVLLQIDGDDHPSAFDSIVAIDANVDELLRFGGVRPESVTDLVHGAMFTRGGDRLKNTAIFFGGSDVGDAEKLFQAARSAFLARSASP